MTPMTQTTQHQWVLTPNGEIDFAQISDSIAKTINRQAGKIRLERGNRQYGLFHIEQRHGAQIRALGFETVAAFVYESLKNFDQIWQPNQTTQLVAVVTSPKGRTVFIQLKPSSDGEDDFYTVNTAYPVGRGFTDKKLARGEWKELWSRVPVSAA
jgi:hypothetical protein